MNSGGRSGLDVLNAIRERSNGEMVPVAMFTGYGLTPEIEAAILARDADLLHKPVPLETIAQWLTTKVE